MREVEPDAWKYVVVTKDGNGVMRFEGRPLVQIPDDWQILEVPDEATFDNHPADIDKWDNR